MLQICKKTMIYNKLKKDRIVNNNVYTQFGLNRSIRFQNIEQKLNSGVNQGPSVANLQKFKLIQAVTHILVTYKNKEDPIKNEGARVITKFLPL